MNQIASAPRIVVLDHAGAVAVDVAGRIADQLRARPGAVLGLATGETMRPVYGELVRRHREEGLSFARAASFNLDDYVGLPEGHPASFRRFMDETLFDHVDIDPVRTHLPDGNALDLGREAMDYEAAIAAAGGIDLQLLGIGANGHIAFNEPGSDFASRTRVVGLAASTRAAGQASFDGSGDVPVLGLTMGIATILDARRIVLVATGRGKADAVARAVKGPLDPACPASILRTHPDAVMVCDRAAAAGLS
ncbi:glucosamine-6-phosphate deaminase [Bosea sp. (in: a-proteobacteria)]|jgi:glucosamine-6-phosphate deaminase|uniref:glucosamine-6-phosphate deaminase n=1 Tax=Bosea sp. (in: a-proteobacteria) TaxID=1871050 RepID=UPI003F719EE1